MREEGRGKRDFSPRGPTQFHLLLTKGPAKMESDMWIEAWVPKGLGYAAFHLQTVFLHSQTGWDLFPQVQTV